MAEIVVVPQFSDLLHRHRMDCPRIFLSSVRNCDRAGSDPTDYFIHAILAVVTGPKLQHIPKGQLSRLGRNSQNSLMSSFVMVFKGAGQRRCWWLRIRRIELSLSLRSTFLPSVVPVTCSACCTKMNGASSTPYPRTFCKVAMKSCTHFEVSLRRDTTWT